MGLKLFLIFSIVLISLDMLWLSYFAKVIGTVISNIQKSPMKVNVYAAMLAYAIMCVSYYFLAFENGKPNYFKAGLLGLAMYGVYDLTNLSTFKNWSPAVAAQDISWGIFLSISSLYIATYINNKMF